jgi:hypothetical protein
MAEMHRFSSRRQRLDHCFLANRLKGAKSYKRIAGYFRSSIFGRCFKPVALLPSRSQREPSTRVREAMILQVLPCPYCVEQVLDADFWPDA